MSSFIWEEEFNKEYRDLIRSRDRKFTRSVPKIIDAVKKISLYLKSSLESLNLEESEKIKEYFISDAYKSYFGFKVKTPVPKDILIDRKYIERYIATPPTREEKNKDKRNLDFYAVFLGFAGAKGWLLNKTLDDCFCLSKNKIQIDIEIAHFFIPERKEGEVILPNNFINEIDGLKTLIIKEKQEYEDKLKEFEDVINDKKEGSKEFINQIEKIDGKLARAYDYFDKIHFELGRTIKLNLKEKEFNIGIKNLEQSIKEISNDISNSNKDELTLLQNDINPNFEILIKATNKIRNQLNRLIKQNENSNTEKQQLSRTNKELLPFIKAPNIFKAFFEKVLINGFNQRSRLFNVDNEIVPIGFERNLLKSKTENYIDTNYQNGIIYNPKNKALNQKEIFKTLFKKVFKKDKSVIRDTKWIFVLADSGIGKTSLLIRLYLEANKFGKFENKVYFLPFSQRHRIHYLNREEKLGSILFLDAFDEDFSLSKISKLTIDDITHLRELTQSFEKVILTSRSQFFEDKFKIKEYVKNIGTETDFKYETYVLCPFTQEQINTYIKRKFKGNKVKIEKANSVIKYIGEDTNRQLLISQIDLLIDLLDKNDIPVEIKEYHIFDTMLTNWLENHEKTKIKDSNLKNKESRIQAFEKENAYAFCRILAKYFYVKERDFYIGFSLKELKEELDKNKVQHSSLKVNRTFLVLTQEGNYRFAHKSIYEFFLAQIAVEDEVFDNEFFQYYKKKNENDFAIKVYEQYKLNFILEIGKKLSEKGLGTDVQYTKKIADINQYADDIRFEPYFFLEEKNGKQIYYSYEKDSRNWNYFSQIKNDINCLDKILGVKFNCSEGDENWVNENKDLKTIRLQKRAECYSLIKPLFRFMKSLECIDTSELENFLKYGGLGKNLKISNYRGNNVNINSVSNLKRKDKKRKSLINVRGTNQFINTGFNMNVICDYYQSLFKYIFNEKVVSNKLYIHLSHQDLEKGKEHLLDVDRIRVLSKIRGFECVFFTEDKVLSEEEILRCFPDVHKTKLTTANIEYFKKAGNYVDYIDSNGFSLKQGVCEAFEDTVFSKYTSTFPKLQSCELEFTLSTTDKIDNFKKVNLDGVKSLSLTFDSLIKFLFSNYTTRAFESNKSEIITVKNTYTDNSFQFIEQACADLEKYKILSTFFSRLKHFVFINISSQNFFNSLRESEPESLYISIPKDKFLTINMSRFIDYVSLKRMGIENINIDFNTLSGLKNIEEITIKSHKKKPIQVKNINSIFDSTTLKNLTLSFSYSDKNIFSKVGKENKTLEKIIIDISIFNSLVQNKILFSSLSHLEIIQERICEIEVHDFKIDLSFLEFFPGLETLIIPRCNLIGYKILSELNLKNLKIDILVPEKEDLVELESFFRFLDKNEIDNVRINLINVSDKLNSSNLLIFFKKILGNFKGMLQFNYYCWLSEDDSSLTINYNLLHQGILDISIFLNQTNIGIFNTTGQDLFNHVFFVFNNLFELNSINVNGVEMKKNYFKMDTLNLTDNFFINEEFDTLINSYYYLFRIMNFKHIRFIDINPFTELSARRFGVLFYSSKKITLTGIHILDDHLYKFFNNKEIELYTGKMTKDEKSKIPIFEEKIKDFAIKLTINPRKLKIINSEKGIFETQVIFEK